MYAHYWILAAVAAWFGVEFGTSNRKIRVPVQFAIFVAFSVLSFSFGSLLGRFEPTLEGNNQLKNLSRGLVAIVSDSEFDRSRLREELVRLNKDVIPTYESNLASRESVEKFLLAYGIEYEPEIDIDDSSTVTIQLESNDPQPQVRGEANNTNGESPSTTR